MGEDKPLDTISFLARSEPRVRILQHLLAAGSASRRELRTDLDTSRSTVSRSLAALEERDWVRVEAGTYRLTPVGELLIEEFSALLDTVRTTGELSTFVRWFPLGEHDLALEQLSGAEVTTSTEGDPYAPARVQTDLLREAGAFRGILPSVDLEGTRLVHEQVTAGELDAEVVVSPEVARTIRSGEFAELFHGSMRTDRHRVFVAEELPEFYLGLGDEGTVQVGVEDDEGFPRGLLESTDAGVREWAEDVYAEAKAGARRLPAEQFA